MTNQEISKALYEIGELIHNPNPELESRVRRAAVQELLSDSEAMIRETAEMLDLIVEDVYYLGYLWYHYFGLAENNLRMNRLLETCTIETVTRTDIISHLMRLSSKGYVTLSTNKSRRNTLSMQLFDVTMYSELRISINPKWMRHIVSDEPFVNEEQPDIAATNETYLQAWFIYIKLLEAATDRFDDDSTNATFAEAEQLLRLILQKEEDGSASHYPFARYSREKGLNIQERTIIAALLSDVVNHSQSDIDDLLRLICENDLGERMQKLDYFTSKGRLVQEEIVRVSEQRGFLSMSKPVILNTMLAIELLGKEARTNHERLMNFIAGKDIVDVRQPVKGLSDIVLSDELAHNLQTAVKRYETDTYSTLESWGLYTKRSYTGKKYQPKLVMLFYGPPGTGKTLASEAIAKELGKDLLVTDVSRIVNPYVGVSQKNTSTLFSTFAELNRELENPPVLLLNECDQLLSTRGGGSRSSVDMMYHQMQNLILESLENIQGIVILTTNLVDTLDPAFSRRFDLKIRFPEPTMSQRESIWKMHLLSSIPGSNIVDTKLLSEYELSGGQIAVIIDNAATEAASRPVGERFLTTELVVKYAELETKSAFGSDKQKPRVGF